MTERLLLTQPRASRERYGTDSHAAWSYRQVELELAQFQREVWFDPGSMTLKIDTWRNSLPLIRSDLPETEVIAAIRLERQVRGELSLVYLRVMHRLAVDHGVALSLIPMTTALAIPDELQGIAAKLQANTQGVPLHLDQTEARLLYGRYVHLSAHWNALLGRDLSSLAIFFVNALRPRVGATSIPTVPRQAIPNEPLAAVPYLRARLGWLPIQRRNQAAL